MLACNLDPPNHFDFVLLYSKFIRFQLQAFRGPISKHALQYLLNFEYLSSEFSKMLLADVGLLSVRPSILGALAIQFSLVNSLK